MISYGFFNSIDGDRKYNADTMSNYFRGMVSDGVFESVGNAMLVTAGTGMSVNVGTGKMLIDSRWLNNDASYTLQITAADSVLNRITAIVARLDYENRLMEIVAKDGTPATDPSVPALTNTASIKEKMLAYIYVKKGATGLTQTDITDTRINTEVCGFVTGLITQVDTTQLFLQWQTAYEQFYQSFVSWFDTLTQTLNVNTYIKQYEKVVSGSASSISTIELDMEGYTYEAEDVIDVFVNGLKAVEGTDYTLTGTTITMNFNHSTSGNVVLVRAIKSKIGDPVGGGSYFRPIQIENEVVGNSDIQVTSEE